MPIYEFHCDDCQNDFEHLFRSMNSPAAASCPKCGGSNTHKKFSLFGFTSKGGDGTSRSRASSCASCRAASCAGCRK